MIAKPAVFWYGEATREKQTQEETTMFNTIEIAKRIKQARIDKNMTQMNLAEAMGVSYQAVSSWERGV